MTTKKKLTEEKLRKQKAADAVSFKVTAALVLLFASIIVLKRLAGYYETLGGFDTLFPMTLWAIIGGLIFSAMCVVVLLAVKNTAARLIAPWGIGLGIMVSLTAFFMRNTYTDDFPLLYLISGAIFVLYIIYQLYRWEFFLFSVATAMAGGAFFQFSRGVGFNLHSYIVLAVLVLTLAGCFLLTLAASKNKGKFVVGKLKLPILSAKSNPMPIYIAAALWLVCGIAVLFLGSEFAYYCMFAAIIAEFIAAVYYTVQLR